MEKVGKLIIQYDADGTSNYRNTLLLEYVLLTYIFIIQIDKCLIITVDRWQEIFVHLRF
jgi:hypothetical protein